MQKKIIFTIFIHSFTFFTKSIFENKISRRDFRRVEFPKMRKRVVSPKSLNNVMLLTFVAKMINLFHAPLNFRGFLVFNMVEHFPRICRQTAGQIELK